MYVHCMYGYVRTLYVRTRTSKKLSFRMLSVPNPYVRACTYNVRTLYVHLPAGWESATFIDCACPAVDNDATYIGRLEYSNMLRVVDQILTFASYLIE